MTEQREPIEQRDQLAPVLTAEGAVDERETVFQTWCMLADRSPTRTAAKVHEEFGIQIKPDTIRKWSKRHGWDLKVRELFEQTAPTFFERTRSGLVGAGPAAQRYLVDVLDGREEPSRDKAMIAFGVLDRIGFLPHTRREAERGQTPAHQPAATDTYEALSDEELRQAIAARVAHLASPDPL